METYQIQLNQYLRDYDNQRAFQNTYTDEYEELDQIEAEIEDLEESDDESADGVARYLELCERRVKLWRILGV